MSHSFTVPSKAPEANSELSRENAKEVTARSSACDTDRNRRVAMSDRLMVPLWYPTAKVRPESERAIQTIPLDDP